MLSALSWLRTTAAPWLGFGRAQSALPVPDEIDRLPLELQYAICQRLDLVDLVTLTSDRPALRELTHSMVDRLAHDTLVELESGRREWPEQAEKLRRGLTGNCRANGQTFPHTQTLANVLDACAGLSTGATHDTARVDTRVISGTGVRRPLAHPHSEHPDAGIFVRRRALAGQAFVEDSVLWSMTHAFCSHRHDASIVRDANDGTLSLYFPSDDRLAPLPRMFSDTRDLMASLSTDGRYVAATTDGQVMVIDTLTHATVTDAPRVPLWLDGVSVDCEGNVLLVHANGYVEVPRGTQDARTWPRHSLQPDDIRHARFAPDDRHVLGVNQDGILLVDRTRGDVTTLHHASEAGLACVGFSPGNAMLSALYSDGVLAVFVLGGARPGAPVPHVLSRTLPASPYLGFGVTWFDQDGSGVFACHGGNDLNSMVQARIPLTRSNRT